MPHVLVVDDEKSIRMTLCAFLEKEGYTTFTASDAISALHMLEEREFDVILTDIIMPRISGIDLLSSIRTISSSVQVIIMTGEPTVDTAVKAVQQGANNYLSKPINKEELLKAVAQAMQIKLLHDEKKRLETENYLYQRNLEDMVEQKSRELHRAMQSIISLLSSVVEVRDPYTAGHQLRVGNLSAQIALRLGLSRKVVDSVRIVGYIHDIGKIVIPTEILSKPGRLSPLEMQMIREHPTFGHEMLSQVDLPDIIAETVLMHHERCDGSGYPRGIRGKDMPIETKILMVADVVEAMMSHRPYRPALGLDAALEEIEKNAGGRYNAEVSKACIALFRSDRYTIDGEQHDISFFHLNEFSQIKQLRSKQDSVS